MRSNKNKYRFSKSLIEISKHTIFHRFYYFLISYSFFYKYKRYLKYVTLGMVGTIVDLGLILIFVNWLNFFYIPIVVISDLSKGFVNFSLHKKYTFKDESKTFSLRNIKSFIRYYFINIVGVILVFILIILFVEFLHFSAFWAKVIADLIINFTRFTSHKKVVFERHGYKLGE